MVEVGPTELILPLNMPGELNSKNLVVLRSKVFRQDLYTLSIIQQANLIILPTSNTYSLKIHECFQNECLV